MAQDITDTPDTDGGVGSIKVEKHEGVSESKFEHTEKSHVSTQDMGKCVKRYTGEDMEKTILGDGFLSTGGLLTCICIVLYVKFEGEARLLLAHWMKVKCNNIKFFTADIINAFLEPIISSLQGQSNFKPDCINRIKSKTSVYLLEGSATEQENIDAFQEAFKAMNFNNVEHYSDLKGISVCVRAEVKDGDLKIDYFSINPSKSEH